MPPQINNTGCDIKEELDPRSRWRSRGRDLGYVANLCVDFRGVLGVAPSGFHSGCSVLPGGVNSRGKNPSKIQAGTCSFRPNGWPIIIYRRAEENSRLFRQPFLCLCYFSYFGKGLDAFCDANFPWQRSRLAVLILNLCINASPLTARGWEKEGCTSGCFWLLGPC